MKEKRVYTNGKYKTMTMPSEFKTGFLKTMDRRTEEYSLLNSAFQQVTDDLGGRDRLSHVQICLAERFCFIEFCLRRLEVQIVAEQDAKTSTALLGRWGYLAFSMSSLAKTIGLKRKTREIESNLKMYIEQKKKGKPGRPKKKKRT